MALAADIPYELIRSLRKFGFVNALDRKVCSVNISPNNEEFIKYECHCISNKQPNKGLGILLRPYSFDRGQELTYYVGQCPRCETVYWTQ